MVRVLLTGAAGFIGSHTAEALLKRGDSVHGVDEINDYYSIDQKEDNLAILGNHENFTFTKLDICDEEKLRNIFKEFKPTHIIHLAARAGVRYSLEHPEMYYHSNLLGTLTLLKLAAAYNVNAFIFASSSSVYGSRAGGAFKESDRVDNPVSPYAATKKACEELCFTYHHLHNIPITCLRFFTVYGPRGRPDMAPYIFLDRIRKGQPIKKFGDGTSARGYTFIKDIVSGVLAAMDNPQPYEIINLGHDHPISLNDFISTSEKIAGKRAIIEQHPMQPGDVPFTCADLKKAKELLNYAPTTSLKEGLQATWDWLQSSNIS